MIIIMNCDRAPSKSLSRPLALMPQANASHFTICSSALRTLKRVSMIFLYWLYVDGLNFNIALSSAVDASNASLFSTKAAGYLDAALALNSACDLSTIPFALKLRDIYGSLSIDFDATQVSIFCGL
jgi:hypothetical protein